MPLDTKLYVGDLPRDVSEKELERAFNYYGPLRNVWVARNPPGFAFIEFEDSRDADDAVRSLDGANVCGARVRVEHSTGKVRPKPWQRGQRAPPPPPRRGGFNPNDRCYECGERGHYAYDCRRRQPAGGRGRRSRSRSRSGSRDRRTRSRSRSHSRSRSRSAGRSSRRNRSRSASRSRSRSKGRDGRSPVSNHASPPKENDRD